MRAAAIEEMGSRAEGASAADQLQLCEQLIEQIRTEPDPIVRRTIQQTIAQIEHPLALEVLTAGLNDADRDVRLACCRGLARRGDASSVPQLARVVTGDEDIDVRIAAVAALGQFKSPHAVRALGAALHDRDPALQYAGVEAMRNASGEDHGNDVQAWRQYAASVTPANERTTSVAESPASTSSY